MVNAMATSILAYGRVLFACLGDVPPTLHAHTTVFEDAETFVRDMLRWALHQPRDTRGSFLYVMANMPNLQLLCKKACLHFFLSLDTYERFATEFKDKIYAGVDHDLLGLSTFTWWPEVALELRGRTTTTPFYTNFRKLVKDDLLTSTRLADTGLASIMKATLRYCFKGCEQQAPTDIMDLLADLMHKDHAITRVIKAGSTVYKIATVPSWLTSGRLRHLSFLRELFYGTQSEPAHRLASCHLCQASLGTSSLWHHLLRPCPKLRVSADGSAQWHAFVDLLHRGHQGLAIYTCLPLLHRHHQGLLPPDARPLDARDA